MACQCGRCPVLSVGIQRSGQSGHLWLSRPDVHMPGLVYLALSTGNQGPHAGGDRGVLDPPARRPSAAGRSQSHRQTVGTDDNTMTHFFYMDEADPSKVAHWYESVGPVAF